VLIAYTTLPMIPTSDCQPWGLILFALHILFYFFLFPHFPVLLTMLYTALQWGYFLIKLKWTLYQYIGNHLMHQQYLHILHIYILTVSFPFITSDCLTNCSNIPCIQKCPSFIFFNNCQKLTDFNDFWYVKSWQNLAWTPNILHICLPHLSNVATLPWEIKKVVFQQYYSYTSDYLHYLRRKQIATIVQCLAGYLLLFRASYYLHSLSTASVMV